MKERKQMNKKQLEQALAHGTFKYNHTGDCINALNELLESEEVQQLGDNEDIEDNNDFYDWLWAILDNYCIYYADAFTYLQECNITDYKNAFAEGFTTINQLHYYYLEQEIGDAICEINNDF